MSVGRPTKFTEEVKVKLLVAIRKGAPYVIACNYAGIGETSFHKWKSDAKKGLNPEFAEFMKDLKAAEGETALNWLHVIDKAMIEGNWQAAAWKLERRYFSEFSSNPVVREEFKKLVRDVKKLKRKNGESHGSEAKKVDTENAHEKGCPS